MAQRRMVEPGEPGKLEHSGLRKKNWRLGDVGSSGVGASEFLYVQ